MGRIFTPLRGRGFYCNQLFLVLRVWYQNPLKRGFLSTMEAPPPLEPPSVSFVFCTRAVTPLAHHVTMSGPRA